MLSLYSYRESRLEVQICWNRLLRSESAAMQIFRLFISQWITMDFRTNINHKRRLQQIKIKFDHFDQIKSFLDLDSNLDTN